MTPQTGRLGAAVDTVKPVASGAGLLDVVVDAAEHVADQVVSLVLRRIDGESFPEWAPGAHIDVHLGDGLTRQYSLCSDLNDREVLRIGVLRVPDSRGGSEAVHEKLVAGTPLTISAPRNNFPMIDSRKYLFIAGGIGITPIIPMIEAAEAAGREWRLVYGGRSRHSMAFAQSLEDAYGSTKVNLYPEDEVGRLDLNAILGMPRAHMLVYACGPGGMLGAIEDLCMGWPPGALHLERFSADTLGAGSVSAPFEVELAKAGRIVTVQTNESILDAVEKVGVRILSSCRAGLCGTCETNILSGTPEHRDAVLTEADKDANEVMLVCVSRAAAGCDRLVLDL
ncbi:MULTISPECIES: PDR/VanB family oxidoreductase [Micrococcaceae]|uniref:PDR/VanB family oxidoreductase n=1 Tax=Micrococcaceae TaxID=1268 RepID=UPI0009F5FCD9|nr:MULTISPECIES: PDR/VanB family oxidoreductase [Micrococcaceae]MDQ0092919.1 ferredoxin-NADP reductase [Paeniglutamicibacter psychrophenolicus]